MCQYVIKYTTQNLERKGVNMSDENEFLELIDSLDAFAPVFWRDLAGCRGMYDESFFPGDGESDENAKRVCGDCSVRNECLDYALENGEKCGIWGGLDEKERRKVLRERASKA